VKCRLLQATGAVYWDAVGSIAVSALLGVVDVTLIQRNRKWLIGKSMPKVGWWVVSVSTRTSWLQLHVWGGV